MRTFLAGCLLWCVLWGRLAWGSVPPEVQLCLQHLKPAEREKAARALGPLEALPRYRVRLEVDPAAREVTGRVEVEVTARERPLTELYLRLTPNAQGRRVTLTETKLGGEAVKLEQPEPTLYRVPLKTPVPPGQGVVLDLTLKAVVPAGRKTQASGGLGLLGGGHASGGDHGAFSATADFLSLVGVVPQVPPVDAAGRPWAGPQGIGDLALYEPAHVLATVTVPSGWKVHATGAPMGEVPEKDGRIRYAFAAGAVRDFPILVSRGYEVSTATVNGVTVESHYAARDKAVGEHVLRYASAALVELEQRLGPLPYRYFRVVEAPLTGGAGGMEFPGLITVATSLYRGMENPAGMLGGMQGMQGMEELLQLMQQMGGQGGGVMAQLGETLERTLEFTVAHEVAHQYFAGLVGSDPIHAPVVDESLAQYTALLYFEWKHGREAAAAMRKEALVSAYHLYRLTGGKDGKADRPTGDFADELEYGALVYGKAPLMHHAARKLVGDLAFFQGLRAYVDTYRFKWACNECFTQQLAKASPQHARPLERLRARWWQEAHGDEDLGAPDMGALLGGMGAMDGLQLDPESMKMLQELLPGLLGQ
jgi:hypothetical protein